MELTIEQAREYLASVGITLPDFMLTLLVARANSIDECLTANYDAATALLIKLYLIGLFGLTSGDKYVTSQTAPNGASRSFRYGTLADRYRSGLGLLRGLDVYGCTLALVPPDPTAKNAVFMVASGKGC